MQSYVMSVEQADNLPLGVTSQQLLLLLVMCFCKLLVLCVRKQNLCFALD